MADLGVVLHSMQGPFEAWCEVCDLMDELELWDEFDKDVTPIDQVKAIIRFYAEAKGKA